MINYSMSRALNLNAIRLHAPTLRSAAGVSIIEMVDEHGH
jgi:hypothetical protein